MNKHTDKKPSQAVLNRALQWGWTDAPDSVLEDAETSIRWANMRVGEILIESEVMNAEEVASLLRSKPADVKALDWFAKNSGGSGSKVRSQIDRILVLKKEMAFYNDLNGLDGHPAMQEGEVARRCNELDAALMLIEMKVPILVFSHWDALFAFMTAGQEARMNDPIRKKIPGNDLKLACSSREQIALVLGTATQGVTTDEGGESDAIWQGNTSELPEQKELARLIEQALAMKATDISLKPFKDGSMQVLVRRYGDLVSPLGRGKERRFEPALATNVVQFLAQRSGANPNATRMVTPRDGQITYRSAAGDVFLRLSFLPLLHPGERRDLISVSIRLLPRAERSISVQELKLAEPVQKALQIAMRFGRGFVLVAGPTNSGKSTTGSGGIGLHVGLFGDTRKRIAVEQPIERFTYGVTHVNVREPRSNQLNPNGAVDDPFVPVLRAIKRHDPDFIIVGEIRDSHTANLCVTSATSGHLVLSTIHADDTLMAADVLARMVDPSMTFQLMESLSLVLSQRLVKTLCPECKSQRATTQDDKDVWRHYCETIGDVVDLPEKLWEAKPEGCDAEGCYEGYADIQPINEVLPFTRKAKTLASRLLTDPAARDELAKQRTVRMIDECLRMLVDGKADLGCVLV